MAHVLHHIPVCPFSQRLEILLTLKGRLDAVEFRVVDITKPRSEHLLRLTGGTTALPVLELEDGRSLKESLVLMEYLEDTVDPPVRRRDAYQRAVERLMVNMEGPFVATGYRLIMNQERERRDALVAEYLEQYARLDVFLRTHGGGIGGRIGGPFLFDEFGWVEAVFTPFFRRFELVRYYEDIDLPATDQFTRIREFRSACLEHPAAQQVSTEEIVKVYYDYARGVGNGKLPEGREVSSFALEPHWQQRPMPPKDKYQAGASDAELGLTTA